MDRTTCHVVCKMAIVVGVVLCVVHVSADTCDDSYLLPTNKGSPSGILSVASINGILTEHNNARRKVNPVASNMPMLTWNQTLADFAQEYISRCAGMVHSTGAERSNPSRFGYSYIGENLAAGSGSNMGLANGGKESTKLWNGEIVDWTYPMMCGSGKVCGHYTQVIWAGTRQVGCGYAYCASQPYKNYWSCNYGPGGNSGGNPYPSSGSADSCQTTQTLTAYPSAAPYTTSATSGTTTAPGGAPPPSPVTTTTTSANGPAATTTTAATTSSFSIPTTTRSPSVLPIFKCRIKLGGNFWGSLMLSGSPNDALVTATKADIAIYFGISSGRITMSDFALGSLFFSASVYASDGSSSSGSTSEVSTFRSKIADTTTLSAVSTTWRVTSLLYNATTGSADRITLESATEQSINVGAGTTTTSAPPPGDASLVSSVSNCVGSCVGFVMSVLLGAGFIAGLGAVLFLYSRFRK